MLSKYGNTYFCLHLPLLLRPQDNPRAPLLLRRPIVPEVPQIRRPEMPDVGVGPHVVLVVAAVLREGVKVPLAAVVKVPGDVGASEVAELFVWRRGAGGEAWRRGGSAGGLFGRCRGTRGRPGGLLLALGPGHRGCRGGGSGAGGWWWL